MVDIEQWHLLVHYKIVTLSTMADGNLKQLINYIQNMVALFSGLPTVQFLINNMVGRPGNEARIWHIEEQWC